MFNERKFILRNPIRRGARLLSSLALAGNLLGTQPAAEFGINCPQQPGGSIEVEAYVSNPYVLRTLVLHMENADTGEGGDISDDKPRPGFALMYKETAPFPYKEKKGASTKRYIEVEKGHTLRLKVTANTPGQDDSITVADEELKVDCP